MINNWKELKFFWRSDFYRYTGKISLKLFLHLMWTNPGFKYTIVMRFCSFLANRRTNIIGKIRFRLFYELLRHYEIKYGILISPYADIGTGFYISHYGGVRLHFTSKIGKNCNVGHNVTVAQTNRGANTGAPTIGDNVYIGPGAIIIGNVKIGNNVLIGPNSLVIKDVPDNAVVGSPPAQILSYNGSVGYINRTDYIVMHN